MTTPGIDRRRRRHQVQHGLVPESVRGEQPQSDLGSFRATAGTLLKL
jgi:hypothetical protein